MKKILLFLLLINALLAFTPVYAPSSIGEKQEYKKLRIVFENRVYLDLLEEYLEDRENLSADELVYLNEEVAKTKDRIAAYPIDYMELSYNEYDGEVENYKRLLEGKVFVYEKADSSYEFYKGLIKDNLRFVRAFKNAPNQIKTFEGYEEVLGVSDSQGKLVLTFDDGPSKYTPKVLDTLIELNTPAVFFILGDRVDAGYNSTLKRTIDSGFEVAYHSQSHKNLIKLDNEANIEEEVYGSVNYIEENFDIDLKYFRAPYGSRNEEVLKLINSQFDHHILWNIDSVDWHKKFTEEIIIERVIRLAYLYNGGIVLFHDLNKKTPEVIGPIIERLDEGKFEFVTLDKYIRGI